MLGMLLLTNNTNCELGSYANSCQRWCTALNNHTHARGHTHKQHYITQGCAHLSEHPVCLSLSHLLSHLAHILPLDLFSYSEVGPCGFSATTYLTPSHLFDGNSKSWQFPHTSAKAEGSQVIQANSEKHCWCWGSAVTILVLIILFNRLHTELLQHICSSCYWCTAFLGGLVDFL